jgi:hypothetical protein
MKAEHRHQLHKNLLADRMGRLVESMKSTPKTTSALVWTLVLLSLGTLAVWQYWGHATQVDSSARWTDVDAATHDPRGGTEKLQYISKNYPGTLAARTAEFQTARLLLQEGERLITSFRNKEAVDGIKTALRLYAELAQHCPDAPLLEQEALMAIAKAKESLIGVPAEDEATKKLQYGTLEQALEAYQQLQKKFPNSTLGKMAEQRIKEIEDKGPQITKFYEDKLRAAATHPVLPDLPQPLTGQTPPK